MNDSTDDRPAAGEGAASRPDEWDFSGPAGEAARRNAASRAGEASSWNEEDFARISASPRRIRRKDARRTTLAARLHAAMSRARLPRLRLPVIPIPAIHLPRVTLPRVTLPNLSMPRVTLPRPRLPNVAFPRVRFPSLRLPSLRLPSVRLPRLSLAARLSALAVGARAFLARQGARIGAAGGAVRDLSLRVVFALLQGAIVLFFRVLWPLADAAAGTRRGAVALATALRDGGLKGLAVVGWVAEGAAMAVMRAGSASAEAMHRTARAGSLLSEAMFAGKGPQWRAGAFAVAGFCLFFVAARNAAVDWQGAEAVAEAPSASAPVAVATAEHLFEEYRVPTPLARIPFTGTRRVAVAQAQGPAPVKADLLPPRFNLPGTQRGRDYRASTAEAQVRLLRLGYAAGAPTGEQSPRTSQALALFQKKAGLPVTGEVDMATLERLRRASAS